jgi:hypothetical protein
MKIKEIILETNASALSQVNKYMELIPDNTLNSLVKMLSSISEDEKNIDPTVQKYIESLTDEEKEALIKVMKKESLKRKSKPKPTKSTKPSNPEGSSLVRILKGVLIGSLLLGPPLTWYAKQQREEFWQQRLGQEQEQRQQRQTDKAGIQQLLALGDKDGYSNHYIDRIIDDSDYIYDLVFSKNYRDDLILKGIVYHPESSDDTRFQTLKWYAIKAKELRSNSTRPSKEEFRAYLWLNYHRQGQSN